jgi:hypothetical protein
LDFDLLTPLCNLEDDLSTGFPAFMRKTASDNVTNKRHEKIMRWMIGPNLIFRPDNNSLTAEIWPAIAICSSGSCMCKSSDARETIDVDLLDIIC